MQYGVFENLSYDDYAAIAALRSSSLEKFTLPTDAHARYDLGQSEDEGDALIRGRVLHTLLLEPHRLDLDYSIERTYLQKKTSKVENGGSKEKWDALKEDADRRLVTLVPHKLYAEAEGMAESIRAHPEWKRISEHAQKELTVVAEVNGQPMKVRYDLRIGETVLDIKSCKDYVTDEEILKVIRNRNYHMKAAMYLAVGQAIDIPVQKFQWIFVENFAPYLCRFVEASEHMLEVGSEKFYACLERCQRCRSTPRMGRL